MNHSLSGKVVLITGAARGIGAETARRLAARGAKVSLAGLEPERLRAVAEELGPGHIWSACDVTSQAELDQAVLRTAQTFGKIDVVIANAGIADNAPVGVNPPAALARTIEVNLIGVVRTVCATLQHLEASRGYYLLLSSAAALVTSPGLAAYSASKVGIEHFGAALRLELLARGIGVGVAFPSWIDTDLVRDQQRDVPAFRTMLSVLPGPLGRINSLEACADALVDAIVSRRARVYVPRSLYWLALVRSLLWTRLGDYLTSQRLGKLLPLLESEARGLNRAFGRSSVETAASDAKASDQTRSTLRS
jgi:NAD(P)-dependent dehydrogenase (short-subunit alcohol dehydrogenase family)